jgi:hypothetical protein
VLHGYPVWRVRITRFQFQLIKTELESEPCLIFGTRFGTGTGVSVFFKESESDPGLEPGANQQLTAGFGPSYLDLGLIFRTRTGVLSPTPFLKKQTQIWNHSNLFYRTGTRGSS